MRYISTRGGSVDRRLSEVFMEGLAPEGGLYVPTIYPKVDDATCSAGAACRMLNQPFEMVSVGGPWSRLIASTRIGDAQPFSL